VSPSPSFSGVEDDVWRWDEIAQLYVLHRFYEFEPELANGDEAVRRELADIVSFWCRLGIGGIRVDAAAHLVEKARQAGVEDGQVVLRELAKAASGAGEVMTVGETDVEPEEFEAFVGRGGMLDFILNLHGANYLFLALARADAQPLAAALERLPRLEHGGFANFLRNHDELGLERLAPDERRDVFERFAPEPRMRIYGRGIRRRLAPMLGDEAAIELAIALVAPLPGIPVLLYGDEIGLGEDLSRREREAVRTAFDWDAVQAQRGDAGSLLERMRTILHARQATVECLGGDWEVLDTGAPSVLAVRSQGVLGIHNLAPAAVTVELDLDDAVEILADGRSDDREMAPYGYRWLRE
jgi:maltose alpha-D-glucosyltransferase/alpha-amylase